MSAPLQRGRGFTLIEVLVVLALILVLAALLVPAVSACVERARSVHCLGQLRQLALAAHAYAAAHDGQLPPAYLENRFEAGRLLRSEWDYLTEVNWNQGGARSRRPGLLWQDDLDLRIQQCPSFRGADNAQGDPFTGYNYNTSYLGHGPAEANPEPAFLFHVARPSACAMFGDGEYADGANKFMRAPFDDPEGGGDRFAFRATGTQGYRHAHRTNVAFVDGHAASLPPPSAEGPRAAPPVAPETDFLGDSNELYDLR